MLFAIFSIGVDAATKAMFVCLIFLFISSSVEGSGDKHFSAQSTAVRVGHNITLKCGEDKQENATWTYESTGGEHEAHNLLFSTQNENDGRFLLKNTTGRYDLFISSAKQSHAGAYTCTIRTQNVKSATTTMTIRIELAVIISGPDCDAKRSTASSPPEESEYISMECFLQFRGNVAPVMEWRNEMSMQNIASHTDVKFNRYVRSTVTLSRPTDQINDTDSISCTIFFNQSSRFDNDNITSAPKFEYVWTSLPIASIGIGNRPSSSSSSSSSSDFSESKRNTSPNGAKTEDDPSYWSPLLTSLIALTAILAIVILISFLIRRRRRRERAPKGEQNGAERIYYEDPTEVAEIRQAQVTSDLVRIFYENPTGEDFNNALQSTNDDLDNVYSEEPVVILTNNDNNNQSQGVRNASELNQSLLGRKGRRPHEYLDMDLIRESREAEATTGANSPDDDNDISSSSASSQQVPGNRCPDSDRIIYMEMTSSGRRSDVTAKSKSRQRTQPLFNKSVYAAIDHTLQT